MAYVYLRDTDRQTPPATLAARTWFVPASVSVGLRFSDLLFSIGYSVTVRLREQERADLPPGASFIWLCARCSSATSILASRRRLINGGAGPAIATGTYITPQTGLLASPPIAAASLRWRLRCAAPAWRAAGPGVLVLVANRHGAGGPRAVDESHPEPGARLHRACWRRDLGPAHLAPNAHPAHDGRNRSFQFWRRL